MARISTYQQDSTVNKQDKVIGTDSATGGTKNFTLESITDLVNDENLIDSFDGAPFEFQDYVDPTDEPAGILNLNAGSATEAYFSAINTLYISVKDKSGSSLTEYLENAANDLIKISKTDDLNQFGIYKITAIADFGENKYKKLSVTPRGTNGMLTVDTKYFVSNYSALYEQNFSERNVTEFADVTSAGSGIIISDTERSNLNDLNDNALLHSDVVNVLTSTADNVPLSAAQGKTLKDLIDTINTLLTSDNVDLDSLQEVVDFIEANRNSLDSLTIGNIAGLSTALSGKEDSVEGKGLSANDFTDTLLTKLNDIAENAEVNVQADWAANSGDAKILNKPADLTDLSLYGVTDLSDITSAGSGSIITGAERTKLSAIEAEAEVNVQSNWTAESGDAFIQNKPTTISQTQADNIVANNAKVGITTEQADDIEANNAKVSITSEQTQAIVDNTAKVSNVQANWNAQSGLGEILNKPDVTVTKAKVDTALSTPSDDGLFYRGDGTWAFAADSLSSLGISSTATEINYLDGASGALQPQIDANTSKVGITTDQATAITANSGKVGITSTQADAIVANSNKTGITASQASAITANTSKVGITTDQADDIEANNAKIGITSAQAAAIVANTDKVGITTDQANDIAANNAKVGITQTQADAISTNTNKVGITQTQADAITANTSKVGITSTQASAITANTNKVGITSAQASAITANTSKVSNVQSDWDSTTGLSQILNKPDLSSFVQDDGKQALGSADTVLSISNNNLVLTRGDNSTNTVDLSAYLDEDSRSISSGTLAAATGIVTFTRDDNSTFTLDLSALLDDSNLVTSVNGAAGVVVLDTDDVSEGSTNLYHTTARARAAFSGGTNVTIASDGEISAVGVTSAQAQAITANSSKVGITQAQADAISANSSKVGITSTQAQAISDNSAKVGITSTQATAISNNSAKVGITGAQATAITNNSSKVSFPGFGTTSSTALAGNTSFINGSGTNDVIPKISGSGKTLTDSVIAESNSKIGIGTTSPGHTLSVNGPVSSDFFAGYTYPDNSFLDFDKDDTQATNYTALASIGRIAYLADTNSNEPTTNAAHEFFTGTSDIDTATSLMVINTNGNVGIGTTSPVNPFHVQQGNSSFSFSEYNNGATLWLDGSNGDFTGGDYFNISANGTTDLAFGYSGVTKMLMKSDGKLGIGTTSPRFQLDLAATGDQSDQADYIALGVRNGPSSGNGTALGSGVLWKVNYTGYTKKSAGIVQVAEGNYFRSGLAFYTNGTSNATTDYSERLRISSAGNVGIGTTTPSEKLEVAGKVKATSGFHRSDSQGIILSAGSGIDTTVLSNGWTSGDGDWLKIEVPSADNESGFLQLNSNGNVGIGTTSPNAKLTVTGNGGSTTPTLALNSNTSHLFNHGINSFNSSLTAGENQIAVFGKSGSSYNSGYIGYKYNAASSATNLITIGHWGANNLVNIDGNGNVGIGTESPTQHISTTERVLHITNSNVASLNLDSTGSNGDCYVLSSTASGDFRIYNDDENTTPLAINSSDNIGIGTTSPAAKLSVAQPSSGDTTVLLGRRNSKPSIKADTTEGGYLILDSAPNGAVALNHYSSKNVWLATGGGKVGIGTTNPAASLDVATTDAIIVPKGTTSQRPATGEAGMLRYNTNEGQFEGYTTEWGAIAGSGGEGGLSGTIVKKTFSGNGSNRAFVLDDAIASKSNVDVYVNGVYQFPSNYEVSGSTVTFDADAIPATGTDNVSITNIVGVVATEGSSMQKATFTGNGSTTTFDLGDAPQAKSFTIVHIEGIYQESSTYSISGSDIVFTTAPPNGHTIEVTYIGGIVTITSLDVGSQTINSFTGTGSATSFNLGANAVEDKNYTDVYINGVYQAKNTYSLSGTNIVFSTAPQNGYSIEVKCHSASPNNVTNSTTMASDVFTADGSTSTFALTNGSPPSEEFTMVFVSGIYQQKSAYNLVGSSIVFQGENPAEDDTVEVISLSSLNNVSAVTSVNGQAGVVTLVSADIPGVVDTSDDTTGLTFWTGTQAEYDALSTYDSTKLYFIT